MPIENLIKKENHRRYWRLFFILCGVFFPGKYVYLFFTNEYGYYLLKGYNVPVPARYYLDMGIALFFFTAKYFILIAPSLMILAIIIIEGYDLMTSSGGNPT